MFISPSNVITLYVSFLANLSNKEYLHNFIPIPTHARIEMRFAALTTIHNHDTLANRL